MKKTIRNKIPICMLLAAGSAATHAGSFTWDPGLTSGSGGPGTWNLTTANWYDNNNGVDAQWTDVSALGTDQAIFSGTAGTVTLNTSLSASNLLFYTFGYTLTGAGTLQLGGGIDNTSVGSGTSTISVPLALVGPQQSWASGSGGIMAVNSTVTRSPGAAVDFSASGITSSTLANTAGILGAWATVGAVNSTAGDWAANDGSGNIIAYTGYTVVSSTSSTTQTGAGASAQNWVSGDPTGAANDVTTLSASATLNSLVQQGDFQVNSGVTLTLNSGGLLLRGISRWLTDGSATTSVLTSGAGTGELFVHVPDAGSGDNWTLWPIIADNGSTPLTFVKDGAGLVKLGNMSTYTGGTLVNAGTLASTAGAEYGFGNAPLGIITPFGYGSITVANNAMLQLGSNPGNTFGEYDYTNSIIVNGGMVYESDGFQHLKGALTVGALGCSLGATYDNDTDALLNGVAKGLFMDGLVTGSAPLTIQDSGIDTANGWDSSTVYFTGLANPYSGTVTVNTFVNGGSYLFLLATNSLVNATINLTGDNGAGGRFGPSTLLFGSGTNLDGVGYAAIGGLVGSGDVVLADTLVKSANPGYTTGAGVILTVGNNNSSSTYSGVLSGGGGLIKVGSGTLTLSGGNTYVGNTTLSGGALILNGGWLSSSNVTVAAGTTLDISSLGSVTLAGNQALHGGGTVNGTVYTSSGSSIYAGNYVGYATNSITGDLSLASGTVAYFNVGTVYNGANDQVTVGGTLSANNNVIHLKAPSTSASLDATADYVLFNATAGISGSFATTPTWDVTPANAAHYSIVTGANTVTLHYAATAGPTAVGTATPSPALRDQNVLLTVTATNGNAGTIDNVTVDASSIGGSSTLALVNASAHVWTNSIMIPADNSPGSVTLVATVSDTASLTTFVNIPLTVVVGNDVWNGGAADNNFSSNLNWTNQVAPAPSGDSLQFAGTTQLTPNLDSAYTVTGVLFDPTAGSFNLSSTGNGLTLTTGTGVVNNSANVQTLSLPITLASSQTFNTASNDLVVSGTIDDGGNALGLTKTGNRTLTLSGASTYTGPMLLNAGTLNISGTITPSSITAGNVAGQSVLNISGSASITAGNLFVGNVSNAISAVYQTDSSTLNLAGGTGDLLGLGNWSGSYGYFDAATNTTLNINGISIGGESNPNVWPPQGSGDGIMEVNGATVNNGGWIVLARGAGPNTGILNVYGGSLTYAGGGIGCNWNGSSTVSNGVQTSIINLMGGAVTSTSQGVGFRTAGNTGILNLNGSSLLEATSVTGPGTPASGVLNFNGGTLQAAVASTTFVSGLNNVYVYSGGATIDNNGNAITIAQPMLAPTGNGVYGIASYTGGAGYIAPPIVLIANGTGDTNGIGATAIAQINPATGVVTNVLITCPGVNYTTTPVFVISGGGATTPATITGAAPTANTSGGLTAVGSGITTLGGADTYTGNTTVSAGTLELVNPVLAANSTVNLASGAVLQLDFDSTTNNVVSALILDGVSQAVGVYNATTSPAFITGTGNLQVGVPIATNPTNITFSVSGSGSSRTLSLSWPVDHQGWILQAQTNTLGAGLGGNWVDVSGSSGSTTQSIPVSVTSPTVFYRLRSPN